MDDVKGYLKDLNTGLALIGKLSEVHVKNMQMYPFVFFDSLVSANISYDIKTDPSEIESGQPSSITYELSFAGDESPLNLAEGFKNTKLALSTLFGQKIRLTIKDQYGQILMGERSNE